MIVRARSEELKQTGELVIDTSKVYESLRYNDYSVENGLGEIVDNAIEAGAKDIKINFIRSKYRAGKKELEEIESIEIADNGCGMDVKTLAKCLVLGCSMREKKNGKQ